MSIYKVINSAKIQKFYKEKINTFSASPVPYADTIEVEPSMSALDDVFEDVASNIYCNKLNDDAEYYGDYCESALRQEIADEVFESEEFFRATQTLIKACIDVRCADLFKDLMTDHFDAKARNEDPYKYYGVSKSNFH